MMSTSISGNSSNTTTQQQLQLQHAALPGSGGGMVPRSSSPYKSSHIVSSPTHRLLPSQRLNVSHIPNLPNIHTHHPSSTTPTANNTVTTASNNTTTTTTTTPSLFTQHMKQSMSMEEMRSLHAKALYEAEAKRTELRLVLSSRYRELVSSSDTVVHMTHRANELHTLVQNIPPMIYKLSSLQEEEKQNDDDEKEAVTNGGITKSTLHSPPPPPPPPLRVVLQQLLRSMYRAIDDTQVYHATMKFIQILSMISSITMTSNDSKDIDDDDDDDDDDYPLCHTIRAVVVMMKQNTSTTTTTTTIPSSTSISFELQTFIRMIYLQIQTIPDRIRRMAYHRILCQPATTIIISNDLDRTGGRHHQKPSSSSSPPQQQQTHIQPSISALMALYLLHERNEKDVNDKDDVDDDWTMMEMLVTTYYQCKTKLIVSLLNQLSLTNNNNNNDTNNNNDDDTNNTNKNHIKNSEQILIQIVQILQQDIIVHPFFMFVQSSLPISVSNTMINNNNTNQNHHHAALAPISLFDHLPLLLRQGSTTTALKEMIKMKCSKFLVTHLPLIRQKVKSILVTIAGTTASALGQIRQSIYDQTDGVDAMQRLDIETWNSAVDTMIDRRMVMTVTDSILPETSPSGPHHSQNQAASNRFSLWGALFSNTFSSLVHSILSTSFVSVHTNVISTLQDLLQQAPSMEHILPHEAYRNTYQIVMELDRSLHKVRMDAYELLVHAEERIESERRLRQSLYVQTCEIIGRLLCELRRMVTTTSVMDVTTRNKQDATKELIIGRLCYLLKFRLSSLRTLLAPDASPANNNSATSMAQPSHLQQRNHSTTTGMISLIDLQSAFELADDDEDGLITMDDAMDVVDSAFSGTSFHGSNIVRETLLSKLSSTNTTVAEHDPTTASSMNMGGTVNLMNSTKNATVTLNELTLVTARGLRHDNSENGGGGALRFVQNSLDHIIMISFQYWSKLSLHNNVHTFQNKYNEFIECATTVPDEEWQRMMGGAKGSNNDVFCRGVSPGVVAYILIIGSILNSSIAPSDCLSPIQNLDHATSLGITVSQTNRMVPTFMEVIRWSLLDESLHAASSTLHGMIMNNTTGLGQCGISALIQCYIDITFFKTCYVDRNQNGFHLLNEKMNHRRVESIANLDTILQQVEPLIQSHKENMQGRELIKKVSILSSESQQRIFEMSDLFVSSLIGAAQNTIESSVSDVTMSSTMSEPMFPLPLPSSRRFLLLPVQVDRSLSDIQGLQNKYGKVEASSSMAMDGRSTNNNDGYNSSNVISGGLGFLSSMLKTKK